MIKIKISDDFSKTPGGRYINEGEFSGEEFRDTILISKYKEAIDNNEKLLIDFDGCYGFPTSFLEETFGGIVRKVGNKKIKDILIIVSNDRPNLKDKVLNYIDNA